MNMGSDLWKSQQTAAGPISIESVREQADKLNTDYRTQMGAAYAGIGVNAGLLVLTFLPLPGHDLDIIQKAFRWALLALMAGGVYLLLEIKRRASAVCASDRNSIAQGIEAYRAELRRRRDYYLGAWRWSFVPACTAIAILFVGGMMYDPAPAKVLRYSIAIATTALALILGVWFQLRKGNEYQRELDALSHAP